MKDLLDQPLLILELKQDIEFLVQVLDSNKLSSEEQSRIKRLYTTLIQDNMRYVQLNNELLSEKERLDKELSILAPKIEAMKKNLLEEIADKNKQIYILLDLLQKSKKRT